MGSLERLGVLRPSAATDFQVVGCEATEAAGDLMWMAAAIFCAAAGEEGAAWSVEGSRGEGGVLSGELQGGEWGRADGDVVEPEDGVTLLDKGALEAREGRRDPGRSRAGVERLWMAWATVMPAASPMDHSVGWRR